jgi:hypothetical protein
MAHIVYFDITAHSPGPNDQLSRNALAPRMIRLPILTLGLLLCLRTASAQTPAFEVASIRPNTSDREGGSIGRRGDTFVATNVPLTALLAMPMGPQAGRS